MELGQGLVLSVCCRSAVGLLSVEVDQQLTARIVGAVLSYACLLLSSRSATW